MRSLKDFLFFRLPHVCPWWFCWTFDNPVRKLIHNPIQILSPYVKDGYSVADIGCGKGYFTIPIAHIVGRKGTVIAFDVQDKMLEGVRFRANKEGVSDRIILRNVTKDNLFYKPQVDFSLAFWMVHEVPDRQQFLKDVWNMIKPGGQLLIVEPKLHVTRRNFLKTIETAKNIGFIDKGAQRIAISYSRLLQKT